MAVLRLVPARGVLKLARLAVPRLAGALAERTEGVRGRVTNVGLKPTVSFAYLCARGVRAHTE